MHLDIQRLSKTYANGVHALQGVSLAIPRGMFGLLGPNGAGKSTLMRILATLQEADSGSATLGDLDVLRQKEALRRVLGYLPQEFGLYPKVSAWDLLDHFALMKGVGSGAERRRTVAALLQQTNLWDARHKKLGGFSGGMRQRFGIAVALIGDPRLIIVDEPTAGLDPAERVRFLNLLSEIGENAVVILSTHIVEDVSELCSRMAIINHGRILLEGEPLTTIERLRGRVWRRTTTRDQLPALEAAHTVISTKLLSGRTVVHVVADARPDASFDPVEPDLEDVYFSTIRGVPLDPPRGAFDIGTISDSSLHVPASAPPPPPPSSDDSAHSIADTDLPSTTESSTPVAELIDAPASSTASADAASASTPAEPPPPADQSPSTETVEASDPTHQPASASTSTSASESASADDAVDVGTSVDAGPPPADSDAGSTAESAERAGSKSVLDAAAHRPTGVSVDETDPAAVVPPADQSPRVDAPPLNDGGGAVEGEPQFESATLPLFPEFPDVREPRGMESDSVAEDGDTGAGIVDLPDQLGLFGEAGPAGDAR